MFKYWKTVYLLFGETFSHSAVYVSGNNPHLEMMNKLWHDCEYGLVGVEDSRDSWAQSNANKIIKENVYAIRDIETDMWSFTPKFYKELSGE